MTSTTATSLKRLALAALLVTAGALGAGAQSDDAEEAAVEAPLTLEELAPGVWAALQPAAVRFDDANSLVVVGESGVLVVDAQTDADAVRWLIAEIRARTELPVQFVVNTHWHADHTQGNALYREAFGDGVIFVGHESLTRDVPERAAPSVHERVARMEAMIPEAEAQLEKGLSRSGRELNEEEQVQQAAAIANLKAWVEANRDVVFVAPTLDYTTALTLHLGEHEVRLMHYRAHTRGDTVVWLPEQKIVATGDMLDDLPFAGHGYPSSWIGALETLRGLDFDTIVPGHGPVFRGKERLDAELRFFRDLVEQVRREVRKNTTLEATQTAVDLSAHREALAGDDDAAQRFFDQTIGEAVERAWREARGELTD